MLRDRRGTWVCGSAHKPPVSTTGSLRFQSAPKEPDVRFSLIRLNHIPSHGGMRRAVTDTSDQLDEPEIVVVDEDPKAIVAPMVAVLGRDEAGHALQDEQVEVVKDRRRVPSCEVTPPADEEAVDPFHDDLDRQQRPPPGGLLADPVLGPSKRTLRRPSRTEVPPLAGEALHSPVMEAQEIGLFRFQCGRIEVIRGAWIGFGQCTPPA
jgi:hypothetical protein